MPSNAKGRSGNSALAWSAAVATSTNPITASAVCAGLGTSSRSACRTVTKVASLPTRSPATLKPCDGSSASRL